MAVRVDVAAASSRQALVLSLSGALQAGGESHDGTSLLDAAAALPPPALIVLDLRGLSLLTAEGARTLRTFAKSISARGIECRLVLTSGSLLADAAGVAGVPSSQLPVFDTLEKAMVTVPDLVETDPLADQFAALTTALLDARTVEDVLRQVVTAAIVIMPGADAASVTLRTVSGPWTTPAQSTPTAGELDRAQYRTGEGPCLDAARPEGPAYAESHDLSAEPRWPRFAKLATHRGLHAVLSTDLVPAGGPNSLAGALNIYSRRAHGLTTEDRHAGLLLATHAALALAHSHGTQLHEQQELRLHQAIDTRDVIGQAKGILMARQGLSSEQAFDLLRTMSQDLNVKLVDLATTLATRHTEIDLA